MRGNGGPLPQLRAVRHASPGHTRYRARVGRRTIGRCPAWVYHAPLSQAEGPSSRLRAWHRRRCITADSSGITADGLDLGFHLVYFWQSDEEFAQGVRFLEPGLLGEDHCVVFGHDEATERAFRLLQAKGFDTESLTKQRRITLLRRESPAGTTLSDIEDVFNAAARAGAPAIRYLGNLGFGEAPLPGKGIADVLELEARVTSLAKRFPAVVVCMYDVNTLPCCLILQGGFQTHPVAVCGDHLIHNPYYIPEEDFLREIHRTE